MFRSHLPALLFLCGYALFLLLSLPRYGLTWDFEVEVPRACAYLDRALGEAAGSGEEGSARALPWKVPSWDEARSTNASAAPCLPGLLAAGTTRLFFQELGWLGAIDACHLGLTLLWLAILACLYLRLCEVHGRSFAFLCVVVLGLLPRLLGHVHNNMKDIPAMGFLAIALLEFQVALVRRRPWRLIAVGIFFGCAISSKLTAVLGLVPMVFLWWSTYRFRRVPLPRIPRVYLLPLLCVPLLAAAIFVGHWPYLWVGPAELLSRLGEIRAIVARRAVDPPDPGWYPLWMTAVTTPPLVLLAVALGIFWPRGRREREAGCRTRSYGIVWAGAILLFFCIGKSTNYDGVRNYAGAWPALAMLAARGIERSGAWLARTCKLSFRTLALLGAASLGGALLPPIALYHPHEVAYFNGLVGGLEGASRISWQTRSSLLEACDYWGSSLRGTVRWCGAHLPAGAEVRFGTGGHLLELYSWREDLHAIPDGPECDLSAEHYLAFLHRPAFLGPSERRAMASGKLVGEEALFGVPLWCVYLVAGDPSPVLRVPDGGRPLLDGEALELAFEASAGRAGAAYHVFLDIRAEHALAPDSRFVAASAEVKAAVPFAFEGAPFIVAQGVLDADRCARIRLGPFEERFLRSVGGGDVVVVAVLSETLGKQCSNSVALRVAGR